ncbi:MAG: NUDIX domain-containing protein [Ruminiclostridium sp.]|nr:NUDIX domain-containing protein [Ruminiclostridium sp.]
MRYEKSCGPLIIRKFGGVIKVLLANHMQEGYWSFPKGDFREDETEFEAVLRIAGEQTGMEVILDTDFRYVTTYAPKKSVTKNVIYYLAISDNSEVAAHHEDIQQTEWLTFKEAAGRVIYSSDLDLLESASKYIRVRYK